MKRDKNKRVKNKAINMQGMHDWKEKALLRSTEGAKLREPGYNNNSNKPHKEL